MSTGSYRNFTSCILKTPLFVVWDWWDGVKGSLPSLQRISLNYIPVKQCDSVRLGWRLLQWWTGTTARRCQLKCLDKGKARLLDRVREGYDIYLPKVFFHSQKTTRPMSELMIRPKICSNELELPFNSISSDTEEKISDQRVQRSHNCDWWNQRADCAVHNANYKTVLSLESHWVSSVQTDCASAEFILIQSTVHIVLFIKLWRLSHIAFSVILWKKKM